MPTASAKLAEGCGREAGMGMDCGWAGDGWLQPFCGPAAEEGSALEAGWSSDSSEESSLGAAGACCTDGALNLALCERWPPVENER